MSVPHRIRVLGKELQVRTSASPEAVREIETFVNDKLEEVAAAVKGGDSQVIATLALLNMAEGYLALVKEKEALCRFGDDVVPRLLERLSDRLDGDA